MNEWKNAVVRVWGGAPTEGAGYLGTAFFISPTQLLTAKHVIDESPEWKKLRLTGGVLSDVATSLSVEPVYHLDKDIALLAIRKPIAGQPITVAPGVPPTDGDKLVLAGYASKNQNLETPELTISIDDGNTNKYNLHTFVGTGMSGGPALRDGRLVGVTQARHTDQNKTYVIPVSLFSDFLKENGVGCSKTEQSSPPLDWGLLTALIDKINHTEKIRASLNAGAYSTFIVYGENDDLPEAVAIRLAYELSLLSEEISPPKKLSWIDRTALSDREGGNLLRFLLDRALMDRKIRKAFVPGIDDLVALLNQQVQPIVFSLETTHEADPIHPKTLHEIVDYWDQSIAPKLSVKHVFLIIITRKNVAAEMPREQPKATVWHFFTKKTTAVKATAGDKLIETINSDEIRGRLITGFEKLTLDHLIHWRKECAKLIAQTDLMRLQISEDELVDPGERIPHYRLQKKIIKLMQSS